MKRIAFAMLLLAGSAAAAAPAVCDGAVKAADRGNRQIPLRVRLPEGAGPHPVILFSHGLGGSVAAGTRWAEAWADAGFAVIHVQHPGSDASLWKGLKGVQAMEALKAGMTAEQYLARVADMRTVLDAVGSDLRVGRCTLAGLDKARIGIAGHSFGAQTVHALAGQRFRTPAGEASLRDTRVRAAIAFSPTPAPRETDELAFGAIAIPFLSVTGTEDVVPLSPGVKAPDRQRPFRAMPAGDKYLLVLDGADHMVFAGGEQRRSRAANDARTEKVVLEATTAFWRRFLAGQPTGGTLPPPADLGTNDIWEAR